MTKAHSRKICTFAHAAYQLLAVDGLDHCAVILNIVETLVLPEVARFGKVKGNETMRLVVLLVVHILCLETREGRMTRSAHLLTQWVRNPSPWKFELEGALGYLVGEAFDSYLHGLTPSRSRTTSCRRLPACLAPWGHCLEMSRKPS